MFVSLLLCWIAVLHVFAQTSEVLEFLWTPDDSTVGHASPDLGVINCEVVRDRVSWSYFFCVSRTAMGKAMRRSFPTEFR
jgi:hypothetical protein